MLTDRIRVDVKSGKGGDGKVAFFKNGKPSGGDGGRGGDVYLEGTNNLYDLRSLKKERKYSAGNGDSGGKNKLLGTTGEDLVLKVPITTVIRNLDSQILAKITKPGERIMLMRGGRGGYGNHYFRAGQVSTLKTHTKGKPGESMQLLLDLELAADIIFIGFPNAGKSSMLNALTNASVAVASYPFTTLQPHLGVCGNVILMDLPGLIEGTSKGKGLGTRFVKHTNYAKAVAHFVSLETEDLEEIHKNYLAMREELKNISEKIFELKEVIVLSKSDTVSPEFAQQVQKEFEKKYKKPVQLTSAFNYDDLDKVTKFFESSAKIN